MSPDPIGLIRLSSPHMSGNEMKYVIDAIEHNQVFPLGQNVADFEEALRSYTAATACSCLSSGTAAIHLALIILGVKPGDEVLCSTFTFAASANPIVYLHAIPVFIDSEPSTWNMDPNLLRQAIQERIRKTGKKPKLILLVHLYGMPADIEGIMAVSKEFDIPVLEDAAEALGSTYDGNHCGTYGEMGVYSFNGNKIITTSGGGALVSANKSLCSQATFLATQARDEAPHYQHSQIGYNYRMSNICAGIGLGQMEILDERVAKRRENNSFYREAFQNIEELTFLTEPSRRYFSNYWLTTILINPAETGINHEELYHHLKQHQIEARLLWKPMHLQPIFAPYPSYTSGVSESLFNQGLCLPSGSLMTNTQREYVAETILKAITKVQPKTKALSAET
ncbi:MAG: aminotransferase class I/II-fold pyridoxal phosphate-dependent enzyme [Chlorobium sp.]|nr:MAG: aminotransferase class I/II-fold pyridoxal phosphate-dependent enzyme [Chlorobium sp.]